MASALMRISILGAMPGGEEWTVNPVYNLGVATDDIDVSATMAQNVATAIAARAVPTGLLQHMSSSTTVTGVRVEARDLNGDLDVQAEAFKATPTPGTGTSPQGYQASIVFSLRTATPGGQGRGRLYWPATGMGLSATTLRYQASTVTTALSAIKTYLSGISTDIDTVVGGGNVLSVWSRVGAALHPVTSIRAGDIQDTQRRRRDVLIEAYQSTVYP